MSPKDRVLRTLGHKKPDRIPYEFSFTPSLMKVFKQKTGAEDVVEYFDFDMRSVSLSPTKLKTDFSKFLSGLKKGGTVDEWGVGHNPGSLYHFKKDVHPLADLSLKEIQKYPFPDIIQDYRTSHFESKIKEIHDKGYFVDGFVGHLFETSWHLRGMEAFLVDMVMNEEVVAYILDKVQETNIHLARRLTEAGADMIRTGDDVGTQKAMMMSPTLWRKWLKPRWKETITEAKRVNPDIHVWYHSDGNIEEIIPDLIEIGIDVLNPVQPECMDPIEIKKKYGDRLSLWGTIGTQTTMPFETPDEVKRVVKERIESLGKEGGLVLAPTHILEPEVPWVNVEAFVEAVKEYKL